MTLTEEQRIAVIKHAVENSRKVSPTQSVEDFLAEIKTEEVFSEHGHAQRTPCLLYTSPSPRDRTRSRMPSSA